jgi:hypothetical protein
MKTYSPLVPKCQAPPAGCFCNPITGLFTRAKNAGADAPSDRTGIGPGTTVTAE